MPGKSSSMRRPTRPKRPIVTSSARKPSATYKPSTKSRPSSHGRTNLLKPPAPGGGSTRRSRSYEASRRQRYSPPTSLKDSHNGRPAKRQTRWRSVSPPRARAPPPKAYDRAQRRRMNRDSEMSADDESRPVSRRPSPTSPRHRPDRLPKSDRPVALGHETPPWPGSPRVPTRPPLRPHPTGSYRPEAKRRQSYEPQRSPRFPPGATRPDPPPGYRPAPRLASEMLRGRPRSRDKSPAPRRYEVNSSIDRERRPPPAPAAKPQPASQKPATKTPEKTDSKPQGRSESKSQEKPANEQPQKKTSELLQNIPKAVGTYAGIQALTEHAGTAKEWADWFMNIQKVPDEIQGLSAKVTTARDTIAQIQNTLTARPDLFAGDDGEELRMETEEAIKNANKALEMMTLLLHDLSKDGTEGTALDRLGEFYRSYKYEKEWKEKIQAADADVQKQLGALNTLMVNIYSRALMKPAPPGMHSPNPPPASGKTSESAEARRPSPEQEAPKSRAGSTGLDPPPVGKHSTSSVEMPTEPEPETAKPASEEETTSEKTAPTEENLEDKSPSGKGSPAQLTEATTDEKVKGDAEGTQISQSPPRASTHQSSASPGKDEGKDKEPTSARPLPAKPDDTPTKPSKQHVPKDDPEDVLLDAAWNGDINACGDALRDASPLTRDPQGLTPLHLAAERDHLAIAMLLVDHGGDCDARANGGRTPLHLAAKFASAAMVEFLVDDGRAKLDARTTDGRTPLHYAASAAADGDDERREVVRILRDWRADPTIEDNKGRTARDLAQKRDYWDVSSTLRRAEKKWEEEHHPNWLQRHGFMK
ncbi:hypothetical protein FZEAL_7673 [Fusarium zealandicum]|uniref:Ankyrin n=1 Tax=Fusarium zealandicum TaxID=1053134 RepID=A0A8H4XHK7_9HYPO|nr:hypothetical protein FZEAL_7673 [Fusarium zealandicum]